MLQRRICPKCGHNHILVISMVPDHVGGTGLEPAKIALVPGKAGLFFNAIDDSTQAGSLSAAVCRACGYTELYTKDPGSIPIDGEAIYELVGPEPAGPFR